MRARSMWSVGKVCVCGLAGLGEKTSVVCKVQSAWSETTLLKDLNNVAQKACAPANDVDNFWRSVSGTCGPWWKAMVRFRSE